MPYMGQHLQGKPFAVFVAFHSTTNIFLRIMALSISNISLQKCYSKTFDAKSYFLLKMQVFPYGCFLIYVSMAVIVWIPVIFVKLVSN